MTIHRTAKGIVLVPTLLLGAAFLAAAAWGDAAGDNRRLAVIIGLVLMGSGVLAQLLPEPVAERSSGQEAPGEQGD